MQGHPRHPKAARSLRGAVGEHLQWDVALWANYAHDPFVVYAGGDFQPTPESAPIARLFLRDVGAAMAALPSATRSIVIDVSQSSANPNEDALRWWGFSEVAREGAVNVLVWPTQEKCELTRNVEVRTGSTLAVFGRDRKSTRLNSSHRT